jgi:hypothetical protein
MNCVERRNPVAKTIRINPGIKRQLALLVHRHNPCGGSSPIPGELGLRRGVSCARGMSAGSLNLMVRSRGPVTVDRIHRSDAGDGSKGTSDGVR